MKDLNFPVGTKDNFGGVDRFWFTPESAVQDIDEAGQVILKEGATWFLGRATKYTLDFKCPAREKRGGTLYEPRLSGVISRITPELEAVLRSMQGNRYILIYKDRNGYLNQVGSIEQGLKFEFEKTTGDTPAAKNGVSFNFSGTIRQDTTFYNREIITTNPGDGTSETGPNVMVRINGSVVAVLPPGSIYDIYSDFTLEFELIAP